MATFSGTVSYGTLGSVLDLADNDFRIIEQNDVLGQWGTIDITDMYPSANFTFGFVLTATEDPAEVYIPFVVSFYDTETRLNFTFNTNASQTNFTVVMENVVDSVTQTYTLFSGVKPSLYPASSKDILIRILNGYLWVKVGTVLWIEKLDIQAHPLHLEGGIIQFNLTNSTVLVSHRIQEIYFEPIMCIHNPTYFAKSVFPEKYENIDIGDIEPFSYVNGNVGIGTTAPQQKLDVAGNINAYEYYKNGNIYSLNPDDLVVDYPVGLLLCDYHGNTYNNDTDWKKCGEVVNRADYKRLANEIGIPSSFETFTLPCPRIQNEWIQNRPWDVNGNNISYNGNGNVGIGTTLPTTKLDVNGEMKANRVIGVDYNDVTNKPVIVNFDFWSDSPVGVIMIWSQTTLPSVKWAWCDGLNGTIDLTGRVPIGATKYSGFDDPLSPNYQRWFNNPNDKIGSGSSYLSDVNIPTHKVYTSGSTANYTHHHQYQKQNYLNRLVAGGAIDAGDPTTTTATNTTSDTHNHTVALYSSGRIYRSSDNTLLTDTNELPVPISLYQPSTYVLFIQKIIP